MFSEDTPVDVKHLTVSLISMVSIIGFFMWLTYVGTNERAEMRNRLEAIEKNLISMHKELEFNNAWKKDDHTLFCLRAQLINKGWVCPDSSFNMKSGAFMNQLNSNELIDQINKLEKEQGSLTKK